MAGSKGERVKKNFSLAKNAEYRKEKKERRDFPILKNLINLLISYNNICRLFVDIKLKGSDLHEICFSP